MSIMSRRDLLRYFAGLSLATVLRPSDTALGYFTPPTPGDWNVLLHGLFVVQWTSPDDKSLMRVIFPAVDALGHEHGYKIGDFDPAAATGYYLKFNTIGATPSPDPRKNILLPSGQLSVPKAGSGLQNVAHCWLDLPRPNNISPLRPKSVSDCRIQFCGRLGKTIQAQVVPTVTLLTYTLDPANLNFTTNVPVTLTPGRNLLLRSEPKRRPTDDGWAAYKQLLACLGLQQSDFETSGDCCPPPAQDENNNIGVSKMDELSLQEIAGDKCQPPPASQPCNAAKTAPKKKKKGMHQKAIQIRACMTVFSTP